jgi:hypothetical protein
VGNPSVEPVALIEEVLVPVEAIDSLDAVLGRRSNRDSSPEPAEGDFAATNQGSHRREDCCDPRPVDRADDVGAQKRFKHSVDAHTHSRSSLGTDRNNPNGTPANRWESWGGLLAIAGIHQAAAFFAKHQK